MRRLEWDHYEMERRRANGMRRGRPRLGERNSGWRQRPQSPGVISIEDDSDPSGADEDAEDADDAREQTSSHTSSIWVDPYPDNSSAEEARSLPEGVLLNLADYRS